MNPEWTAEQQRLYKVFELATSDLIEFCGPKLPALGNKGNAQIVDMAGRQNELRKATDKVEKLLKGVLDSKMGDATEVRGETYCMNKETGIATHRLDQTAAKEMLDKVGVAIIELRKLGMPAVNHLIGQIPDDPLAACMNSSESSRRTFAKIGPPA